MGLKIRTGVDVQKLIGRAKVNELKHDLQRRLESALLNERDEIVARTQQRSVDMHGNTFKPYSRGYAAYKQEKVGHTNVTLTETGNMLQSVQVKVKAAARGIVGKIFFSGTKAADKARKNQESRKFFGLSDEQIARIKKALLGK